MRDNDPEKKSFGICHCIFWISLEQEENVAKNNKEKYAHKCIFPLMFITFWVFWHFWTCCSSELVLLNFEMLQHLIFPTNKSNNKTWLNTWGFQLHENPLLLQKETKFLILSSLVWGRHTFCCSIQKNYSERIQEECTLIQIILLSQKIKSRIYPSGFQKIVR